MNYVFDTGAFIILKNFYPSTFPTLWGRVDEYVATKRIVSVREVYNELHNYNDQDFIQEWAKDKKECFAVASEAETRAVGQIFSVPHFQALIGAKAILKGTPVADPFVVAAALVQGATVVTQELLKPHAAKIPNVCQHFGVPYLTLEGFMAEQGWSF